MLPGEVLHETLQHQERLRHDVTVQGEAAIQHEGLEEAELSALLTAPPEGLPWASGLSHHVPVLCERLYHPQQYLHSGGVLTVEPVGQNVDGDVIHNGCHVWAPEQLAKETRKTQTMGKEEDALSGLEPRSPRVRKETWENW